MKIYWNENLLELHTTDAFTPSVSETKTVKFQASYVIVRKINHQVHISLSNLWYLYTYWASADKNTDVLNNDTNFAKKKLIMLLMVGL